MRYWPFVLILAGFLALAYLTSTVLEMEREFDRRQKAAHQAEVLK